MLKSLVLSQVLLPCVPMILLTRLVPHHGKNHKHRTRVFEIGTEREEFFVPGDPLQKYDTTDYNDERLVFSESFDSSYCLV